MRSTKTKRRVLQGILIGLIGVLVALLWRPAQIQFHLYLFRSDEASARVAMNSACELGVSVRAPLIDAIYAHAGEPDVGFFRPAAFETLACLRRAQAPVETIVGAVPVLPDEEAIAAMAHAYQQEPSAAYRRAMQIELDDVDEWTQFWLWNRMVAGTHPPPLTPGVYAFHPHECGISLHYPLLPEVALRWCEYVAPVLRDWIASESPYIHDRTRVEGLIDARCLSEDSAVVAGLQTHPLDLTGAELDEVLNHAYTYPKQQPTLLSALIQASTDCDWQHTLQHALEIRRPHTETTKEVLRAWTTTIDDTCLADIFPNAPPHERRERMARSLGLAHE